MAATQETLRVENLRQFLRAVNKIERGEKKAIRDRLAKVAEPIAGSARQKLAGFAGANIGAIGPRVVTSGVFVTDRAKKVTGKRGDFGVLIMRVGLVPALEEHTDEVMSELEDALDDLGRSAGF